MGSCACGGWPLSGVRGAKRPTVTKEEQPGSSFSHNHNIGLRVIVEGVENAQQLALIGKLGGNEIQGYLLGRPIPDPSSKILSLCRKDLRTVAESGQPKGRAEFDVDIKDPVRS